MRCPDCEKMVSYGDPEMEVQSEEISDDGDVQISVRMVLPCADCGGELKDNEFELSTQIEHECPSDCKSEEKKGFELELEEPEAVDDYRPKTNKQGKPTPMRYQKHFFGVTITGRATCQRCKEKISFELSDDCQSSGFNELV